MIWDILVKKNLRIKRKVENHFLILILFISKDNRYKNHVYLCSRMSRPLIMGMVHLRALPGTPRNTLSVSQIADIGNVQNVEIYFTKTTFFRSHFNFEKFYSNYRFQNLLKHKKALKEAETLFRYNCDAIIIENMHDVPYQRPQERGPETTAIMSKIASDIRGHFSQVIFC